MVNDQAFVTVLVTPSESRLGLQRRTLDGEQSIHELASCTVDHNISSFITEWFGSKLSMGQQWELAATCNWHGIKIEEGELAITNKCEKSGGGKQFRRHTAPSAEQDGLANCTWFIFTTISRKRETQKRSQNEKEHESVSLVFLFFYFSLSSPPSLPLYPSPINCHLWGNTQAIVNYNATVLGLPLKEFGRWEM